MFGTNRDFVIVVRLAREQDKPRPYDQQNKHEHDCQKVPRQDWCVWAARIASSDRQKDEWANNRTDQSGDERDSIEDAFLGHFQMPTPVRSDNAGDQRKHSEQYSASHIAEQIATHKL